MKADTSPLRAPAPHRAGTPRAPRTSFALPILAPLAVVAGALLSTCRSAGAFGAEDFIKGPFHHEGITERAARRAEASDQISSRPARRGGLARNRIAPSESELERRLRALCQRKFPIGPVGPDVSGSSKGRVLDPKEDIIQGKVAIDKTAYSAFEGAYNPNHSGDGELDPLNTIGWHADYIDSYLYSPLWWSKPFPDIHRFKVSLATRDELAKLHFDDLFSAEQVHYNWRRYATGAMAGLIWAAENNDVAAAQHLVGISLHAMQDFYSHSSWVNLRARRRLTYFEMTPSDRLKTPIFTGAYETPAHLGQVHHGRFGLECSVMNQPGVKKLMGMACSALSPLSNSSYCQSYKECKDGVTIQPRIEGVKAPPGTFFLAPAGIALDTIWLQDIGTQERRALGLEEHGDGTPITGEQMFGTATSLAERHSQQWLDILGRQMGRIGHAKFWQRVRNTPVSRAERHAQFEDYGKLPYQFLSAGRYPQSNVGGEEVFLRVKLFTGNEEGSGTDGDIRLSTGTGALKNYLLDYNPGANPALNYNDFERGDDDVYAVGPFPAVPPSLTLQNDAATTGDVFITAGKALLKAVKSVATAIGGLAMGIIGGNADHVKTAHHVFKPEELANIGEQPVVFEIDLNGGDEGHFTLRGNIRRTGETAIKGPGGWRDYQVVLEWLHCHRESKWDRGSDSDEPFITALLVPLPGATQTCLSPPGDDVDSGEKMALNFTFPIVSVPKDVGYLNLPIALWEHDDESHNARLKLLKTFAGEVDKKAVGVREGFVSALGSKLGAKWLLRRIEVTAWTRNGQVQVGTVLAQDVNRWLDAGETVTFDLDRKALRAYKIRASDLLPHIEPEPMLFLDGGGSSILDKIGGAISNGDSKNADNSDDASKESQGERVITPRPFDPERRKSRRRSRPKPDAEPRLIPQSWGASPSPTLHNCNCG